MKNLTNSIICWIPGSSDVFITPWPDTDYRIGALEEMNSVHYYTGGAAYKAVRESSFEDRKTNAFIEAMHLIIRDKCDPVSVHLAFFELEEYRDGLSLDMPMNSVDIGLSADASKKIDAMYHLEVCFEPMDENGTQKPKEWVDAHITAAHYIVQSMMGGYKPSNYDEIIELAAKYDAIDKKNEEIYLAKNRAI